MIDATQPTRKRKVGRKNRRHICLQYVAADQYERGIDGGSSTYARCMYRSVSGVS